MSDDWMIRIQLSDRPTFKYSARLMLRQPSSPQKPPETAYLYGDGDLAVFLEDRGADPKAIGVLLDDMRAATTAEISVGVPSDGGETPRAK